MSEHNAVVAIYNTHTEAETAIKELQRAAFNITKLSIVGKDYHTDEHVVGYYNTGDRMQYWGKLGAFWGGLWGMLLGAGFFAIPGVGPVLVAGPLLGWVLGALEGAVVTGGMSAIGAGLYSLGIPKDSVLKYEMALKSNKFILVAHGTADEAAQARRFFTRPNRTRSIPIQPRLKRQAPAPSGSAALCKSDQIASVSMYRMRINHAWRPGSHQYEVSLER